jgi:uncharacterized protein YkwD
MYHFGKRMEATAVVLSTIIVFLMLCVQMAAASPFEDELLVLINTYRSSRNLKVLISFPQYNDLAHEHSLTMQEQDHMSHDGFEERFRRASDASSCVENVGWNHETPRSLFDGWRKSPGHNRNLLERKISRAGISKSGAYVTFFACY